MRYRTPFFLILVIAILLAGAVAWLWFHPRAPMPGMATLSADSMSSGSTAPSNVSQSPPPGNEAALVPVTLTPERMQSIGVKTGVVDYKQVRDEIRTTGNVEVDETRLAEVQVRFSGWIQQVYADATFQRVRKGQPLLTIYSPELVTTENEYLLAKQNRDNLAQSTVPILCDLPAPLYDLPLFDGGAGSHFPDAIRDDGRAAIAVVSRLQL